MLSVKVSSKNQISLPSEARKRLGIQPGDRLTVEIRDDALVLAPRRKASERMRGIGRHIWDGIDPVERIRRERDTDEAEDSRPAGSPA
jgi:AbrB family looped-hinge helix DNA binding protein